MSPRRTQSRARTIVGCQSSFVQQIISNPFDGSPEIDRFPVEFHANDIVLQPDFAALGGTTMARSTSCSTSTSASPRWWRRSETRPSLQLARADQEAFWFISSPPVALTVYHNVKLHIISVRFVYLFWRSAFEARFVCASAK